MPKDDISDDDLEGILGPFCNDDVQDQRLSLFVLSGVMFLYAAVLGRECASAWNGTMSPLLAYCAMYRGPSKAVSLPSRQSLLEEYDAETALSDVLSDSAKLLIGTQGPSDIIEVSQEALIRLSVLKALFMPKKGLFGSESRLGGANMVPYVEQALSVFAKMDAIHDEDCGFPPFKVSMFVSECCFFPSACN